MDVVRTVLSLNASLVFSLQYPSIILCAKYLVALALILTATLTLTQRVIPTLAGVKVRVPRPLHLFMHVISDTFCSY